MNNMYDNGCLFLGKINDIILKISEYVKEDVDINVDKEELLKDLLDLQLIDSEMIVCIDYDSNVNYSIDYWTKEDKVF